MKSLLMRTLLCLTLGFAVSSFASAAHAKSHKAKKVVAKTSKKSSKKIIAKNTAKKAPKKMSEKDRKALAWSQVQHARAIAARRKTQEDINQQKVNFMPVEKMNEAEISVTEIKPLDLGFVDAERDVSSTSVVITASKDVRIIEEEDDFTEFENN